jgi:gluconate 2-dehydrogenase gamma chain
MGQEKDIQAESFWEEFQVGRRHLLKLAAALSASAAVPSQAAEKNTTKQPENETNNEPVWQTVRAVQNHLFPASNGFPGADQLNALAYLQNKFQRPLADKSDEEFVFRGVGWLNDFSQSEYKTAFININADQKESLLRKIANSQAGENWLSMILTNLIEALLTDPIYGGNFEGKGWKAVGHIPGYPRSPNGKRYFDLGYQKRKRATFRRTKA